MLDIDSQALVLDLLRWLAERPRAYTEVMEAWRTSCPRFPIWEDAVDHGLVEISSAAAGGGRIVTLSERGRAFVAGE